MQLNLKEILIHLTNTESDIKSALNLIEGDWKTYQNNKDDKSTNWIYRAKDYIACVLIF